MLEQTDQARKEKLHSNAIKVFYVIQRFPGFEGYTGGGAERHLERLITSSQERYGSEYRPRLYVANKQTDNVSVALPVISDPERKKLVEELKAQNSKDDILHLSDSYVLLYNPEIFAEICKFWLGPIVQRVTLLSRMQELKTKYGGSFKQYIAPISAFISQSPEMTQGLIGLGIHPEKIAEIENSVDTNTFRPSNPEIRKEKKQTLFPSLNPNFTFFFYVARLTDPVKKVDVLINEWNTYMRDQNAYLILGGGTRLEETQPDSLVMAQQQLAPPWHANANNIVFTGYQPVEIMQSLYQASDVFVSPSQLEGFSNVALEAMASGLPFIGRKGVSGYGKLVLQNQTGILFENDSDLGQLMHALHQNKDEQNRLGTSARRHVQERYSIEAMAEKYRKLYKRLLLDRLTVPPKTTLP